MPKTKRRLAKEHYDTAYELNRIHDPPKGWPFPPRNVRQKATLWLKRLVAEAGVDTEGLTPKEAYLVAIRALIQAQGNDASYPASNLQKIAAEWKEERLRAYREQQQAQKAETPRQQQPTAVSRKGTWVEEGCHAFARFGLLAGDKIELEAASDPRPNEVLLFYKDEWEVGRFIRHDEDEGRRWTVVDQIDGERWFAVDTIPPYRITAITRRFTPEEAAGAARRADRERRLAELRKRLDKLTDITDEPARFRIEREIYDLERAVDEDEWPEELVDHA